MPEYNKNILVTAFNLPPEEAVKFFERKGFKIAWDWRETLDEANNKTFQVAKAMKMDVVKDIHEEVNKAIKNGVTFENFQKTLKPKMVSAGWWGRKVVEGPEGKKKVQLGSPHRLRTIYDTNVQSANNAGRWKGQEANKARRPWLMLIEILDNVTRTTHRAQSGSIQKVDSSFWRAPNSWYPPNGFRCRGRVRALTDSQAKARGAPIRKSSANPDPGFGGNPGITIWKPNKKDYPSDIWKLGSKLEP